ncbi:Pol protein [Phytophthora palmivora]|uniref:Pol protein n=1 Tax=Phytophthora palmivora TaxID=4796 RepID=A0A2P4XG55_9STRA|nr:Pol protein [Phytophthora palmivora]
MSPSMFGTEAAEKDYAEGGSSVDNTGPRKLEETEKKNESTTRVDSAGASVPPDVKKTSTRVEMPSKTSPVGNQVPLSKYEPPPAQAVKDQYHVFDGVCGRHTKESTVHLEAMPEVAVLLNLDELSIEEFLVELKAGEMTEMVLLNPKTSPEDLNSSSVMGEDVLEGFTKQRATRLGSKILKEPEDPVYHLVNELSDVVSKHPPSQLPPDRGIDLVSGTKYCVTRLRHLPREQCEVIDAFFAEKAKSGKMRESKFPHSTPTFYF